MQSSTVTHFQFVICVLIAGCGGKSTSIDVGDRGIEDGVKAPVIVGDRGIEDGMKAPVIVGGGRIEDGMRAPVIVGGGAFRVGEAKLGIVSFSESQLTTAGNRNLGTNESASFLAQFEVPSGRKSLEIEIRRGRGELKHVVGSRDGTVIALAYSGKLEIRATKDLTEPTLQIEPLRVSRLALSHDGSRLLVIGDAQDVSELDTKSGAILRTLNRFGNVDWQPCYDGRDRACLFADDQVVVWIAGVNQPTTLVEAPEGVEIVDVVITRDAAFVATEPRRSQTERFARLMVGDFKTRMVLMKFDLSGKFQGQWPMASSVAESRGRVLVAIESQLFQCAAPSGELTPIANCQRLGQMQFTASGNYLAGQVEVYGMTGFQIWQTESWKPHPANSLPFDNDWAAAVDDTGAVTTLSLTHICKAQPGKPLAATDRLPKGTLPFRGRRALSGDGLRLALSMKDQVITYDLSQRAPFSSVGVPVNLADGLIPKGIAFNRAGDKIAVQYDASRGTASSNFGGGFLRAFGGVAANKKREDVFKIPSGELYATHDVGDREILETPKFSSSPASIAYVTENGFTWRTQQPAKSRSVVMNAWSIRLSENGSLAVAGSSGKVSWFESFSSEPLVVFEEPNSRLRVDISPDGKTVYVSSTKRNSQSYSLLALSVPSGDSLWRVELPDYTGAIRRSPRGKYVLVTVGAMSWAVIRTGL